MTESTLASVAAVRVPKGGLGHEIRAALVVWEREMIRFRRDPARVISSVIQPLLFLFVLGGGFDWSSGSQASGRKPIASRNPSAQSAAITVSSGPVQKIGSNAPCSISRKISL